MSNFQKNIGGTTACMKRLIMDTKWCRQLRSNGTYFYDSWFSGLKTAEEAMAKGVEYCGTVNTIHKGFCLATLEKLAKYCPGGVISCYKECSKSSWWYNTNDHLRS